MGVGKETGLVMGKVKGLPRVRIRYVLFLDSDEVVEGERMLHHHLRPRPKRGQAPERRAAMVLAGCCVVAHWHALDKIIGSKSTE